MTITNSPSGKKSRRAAAGAGSSAPTRLPSARERRPALAALAVLLIVGGAVLAGWLALRQSQTGSYIEVQNEVSQDSRIERGDLDFIDLPSGSTNFVPADRIGEVVDSYAQGKLFPGQVLTEDMFGAAPVLGSDEALIGLDLQPGQYPPQLRIGDAVWVLLLDDATDSNIPLLMADGTVRHLEQGETGGGVVVEIKLLSACADQFVSGSANGNVALAGVPVTESGETVPAGKSRGLRC